MKLKNLILFLSVFLLCASFASAEYKITQFNASNAAVTCVGGWIPSDARAHDDNFLTNSTTLPGSAGNCVFNFPIINGFINATMLSKMSTSTATVTQIPASCFYKSRLNLTATSSYTAIGDTVFIQCNNGTGQQAIRADGNGDGPGQDDFYELYVNITYTDATDCPGKPGTPVFAEDAFNYFSTLDSCGYIMSPYTGITPTAGQLCLDTATYPGEESKFYLPFQGNAYSSEIFTEEYTLTLANTTYLFKSFDFLAEDGGSRTAYALVFQYAAGHGQISVINNASGQDTLCSDCWAPAFPRAVKVVMYGPLATGYTVLNISGGTIGAIQPNTIAVFVNGSVFFNIPILEPASISGSNIPRFSNLELFGGSVCMDNYKLYAGTASTPQIEFNTTGIPFLQIGDRCSLDWECYTGYCDYLHSCSRKSWRTPCVNDFECVSLKCSAGFCSKATLWQNVDASKDEGVGDDEATNNLISITVSIFMGLVVGFVLFKIGGGWVAAVGAGVVTLAMMFFFVIVSWLSPWILVANILVLAVVTAFVLTVGTSGG